LLKRNKKQRRVAVVKEAVAKATEVEQIVCNYSLPPSSTTEEEVSPLPAMFPAPTAFPSCRKQLRALDPTFLDLSPVGFLRTPPIAILIGEIFLSSCLCFFFGPQFFSCSNLLVNSCNRTIVVPMITSERDHYFYFVSLNSSPT
jgi:hypothetical protein